MRRSADHEFVLALYRALGPLMSFVAGQYARSPGRREEILQESLRKLVERVALLRELDEAALAHYTAVTVRHTAIDRLRRDRREADRLLPLDDLPPGLLPRQAGEEDSVEDQLIRRERVDRLRAVWPRLKEETRMVLEGKYIMEYSDEELARLLGCKPSSVRMRLTRAKREARALMEEEGEI